MTDEMFTLALEGHFEDTRVRAGSKLISEAMSEPRGPVVAIQVNQPPQIRSHLNLPTEQVKMNGAEAEKIAAERAVPLIRAADAVKSTRPPMEKVQGSIPAKAELLPMEAAVEDSFPEEKKNRPGL